jgi:hypothetical protein
MVLREFIEYTFQFLKEAVFHKISFILRWGMNIQNNDMTPATSQYYVRHPITIKVINIHPKLCFIIVGLQRIVYLKI